VRPRDGESGESRTRCPRELRASRRPERGGRPPAQPSHYQIPAAVDHQGGSGRCVVRDRELRHGRPRTSTGRHCYPCSRDPSHSAAVEGAPVTTGARPASGRSAKRLLEAFSPPPTPLPTQHCSTVFIPSRRRFKFGAMDECGNLGEAVRLCPRRDSVIASWQPPYYRPHGQPLSSRNAASARSS
jgi:hypothetical protein